MKGEPAAAKPAGAIRSAAKIAIIYVIFGGLWIAFSDGILAWLVKDPALMTGAAIIKGWFYVAVTAALVYWLVRNDAAAIQDHVQRLRASEERYRQIIETAGDVIVCLDAQQRVREWNKAAEHVLGWPRAEAVGQDFVALVVPPALRANLSGALANVAAGQPWREVESTVQTRTGHARTLLWSANALPVPSGQPLEILAVGHDITERKVLEQQLRQAQKMEALGLLAGGVAHDINNVLTAVFAHVEFIGQTLAQPEPAPERLRADVDQIERAAQRAAILTRQLLMFSRRQVLNLEMLDPNRVLAGMEKMLRRLIWESIELKISLAADVWPMRGDAGQIEQVIMNLAINARDAMRAGGVLLLETSNVTLSDEYIAQRPEARPGPHVCLVVSDTGCGMDEATLQHVFEPFFTTKPVGEGTGLGLATVHGIVRQMGGHITVYSEVGCGTTFRLYFPAEVGALPVPAVASAGPETLGGDETVLVCEDDEAVRGLIQRTLRAQGYNVLMAEHPRHALELAAAQADDIDLLISDVVMPQMNGPELAHDLRVARPRLRVLYISGYTANVMAQHGVLEKGIEFLEKPFVSRRLLQRVREVLDKRETPSGA